MKLRDGLRRVEHGELELDRAVGGLDEHVRRGRRADERGVVVGRDRVRRAPGAIVRVAGARRARACRAAPSARTRTAQSLSSSACTERARRLGRAVGGQRVERRRPRRVRARRRSAVLYACRSASAPPSGLSVPSSRAAVARTTKSGSSSRCDEHRAQVAAPSAARATLSTAGMTRLSSSCSIGAQRGRSPARREACRASRRAPRGRASGDRAPCRRARR